LQPLLNERPRCFNVGMVVDSKAQLYQNYRDFHQWISRYLSSRQGSQTQGRSWNKFSVRGLNQIIFSFKVIKKKTTYQLNLLTVKYFWVVEPPKPPSYTALLSQSTTAHF